MMDKKLTPEQAGDILARVTASMPAPRMDCIGFYLEKFENWLNENTIEEKPKRTTADIEWECPICESSRTWKWDYDDKGRAYEEYNCPNCGAIETWIV